MDYKHDFRIGDIVSSNKWINKDFIDLEFEVIDIDGPILTCLPIVNKSNEYYEEVFAIHSDDATN